VTAALLALWAATGAAAAAPPPLVSGVVLKLPPGEDAALLEGLVAARAGLPLSARSLRRTVTLLYQLGRFSDVVVRAVPAGEGQVTLVVECLPRRIVRELAVRLRGPARPISEEQARRALGFGPGDEFWPGRLDAGLARLRTAYERRGYRAARVAASSEGETQVAVAVDAEEGAPTRIAGVSLGAALDQRAGTLLAGLAMRPGAVLDLEALEEDVKKLRLRLLRQGWLRARVGEPRVEVTADGAHVILSVEAGPRIEFRFLGNESVAGPELRAQLGLDPERPLDDPALDAAAGRLRAFYQERGWAAARVEVREAGGPGRADVTFVIEEGRRYRVARVRFGGTAARGEAWLQERLREGLEAAADEGDDAADSERLARAGGSTAPPRRLARPEPGDAWTEPAWNQVASRVVDAYRAEGFLDAGHEGTRVVLDARAGTAEVEIRLREGPQTRIESVAFEGNQAVSLPQILKEVRLRPGEPLAYAAVEQTRAALLAIYSREGYLYARIQDQQEFSAERTRAALRFRIEEGPRVHIAAVSVAGAQRTRESIVRSTLEVRPGDVYDPAAVARSQAGLLRLGVFRSVALRLDDPEVPESEKDLTVELAERPWRTLAPGAGYSLANGPRAFAEFSQPNLLGRALEFAARAKVNDPKFAYYRREGVDLLPIQDRLEGYLNLGLRDPRLLFLPFTAGAHVDGVGERVHRRAYDMTRYSASGGLDVAVAARLAFSVIYELELDDIHKSTGVEQQTPLTRADVERLRFPDGRTTLYSLRPVLTFDYRDNSVNPRSGWFAAASADLSHSLGSGGRYLLFGLIPGSEVFTDMLKLQGTLSGYLPVGRRVVIALSARAGRVLPLSARSQTIGPKRFFMGGASTMRGWGEEEMIPEDLRDTYLDQVARCAGSLSGIACTDAARAVVAGQTPISVGGQAFFLAKAEARLRLSPTIEVGVFADLGNLWVNARQVSLANLRANVGAGLRFITPVGPAVLDLGVNTAPDRRLAERVVAPHFSIGLF
jgi:outer membrane protein assembly complex protein YaeT